MTVPDELVTATVIGGAVTLLANSWKIRAIAQTLKSHIQNEEVNDKRVRRQLLHIKKKLPNGEVEATFQMVRELHGYFEDEIRDWKLGDQGKAAEKENARMDARHDRES